MKRWYWRGLLDTLVIGLAARCFGLVGALIVGAVLAPLWKWPKPQAITAGVLAVVLFVVAIALPSPASRESARMAHAQWRTPAPADVESSGASASEPRTDYPSAPPGTTSQQASTRTAAAAVDWSQFSLTPHAGQSTGTTQATVDSQATWDADARAFIALHPDLQFNENLEIMDGYARALTRNNPSGYDNATILVIAYNVAKADPRWSKHAIVISMHG